jgi:hypothetical protein
MTHRAQPHSDAIESAPISQLPLEGGADTLCAIVVASQLPEDRHSIFHITRDTTMAEKLGDSLIDFSQQYSNRSKTEGEVSVPNSDLLLPLAFADTQQDVLALCVAILNALEGDTTSLSSVILNPPSPFAPEAEVIAGETVSPQDVKAWISSILKATP